MQGPKDRPADAVAQPVRAAIVQSLRSSSDATLDELAEAAGVHKNTVRAHAEALEQAGVIERAEPAPRARVGRPRTRYRLTEAARTVGPPPLARLLGSAVADARLSQKQARRIGHRHAAGIGRLVPRPRAVREVQAQLTALGFGARVSTESVELEGCPCPVVCPDNPSVVCALVSGAVDGALERLGAGKRVVAAEHDPVARRCTLRLGAAV